MNDVGVCSAESSSHEFDILVDLFPCDLVLPLPVYCDSYAKIFDCLDALDTPNLWEVFFGKDLRLLFVKSQIPINVESCQFFDDLFTF